MIKHFRQWSWLKKIMFSSFVVAVVTGALANAITPFFSSTVQFIFEFALANLGWVITLAIFAIIALLISLLRDKASKLQIEDMNKKLSNVDNEMSGLNIKVDLLNADLEKNKQLLHFTGHSLLQRLPELISAQDLKDLDERMDHFLKDLLADATSLASEVYGASLFLPDLNEKDYLRIWAAYQVAEDSRLLARCYIGPETGRKRGIAGEAYIQGKAVVTRQVYEKDQDGHWKFDNDSYIHFPKSRTYPAFKSNICVPIAEVPLSGGTSSKPLGALCFDSDNTTSFNSLAVQDALKQLGQYIASVLLIYQKLRERYSS